MPVDVREARDRWYVLGVLTTVYAFNIADRFSISTLIEPIRRELQLSDSGVAFLGGSALAMFYVTIGIPIAVLADRANRRNIVAISLALWSAMTALCGASRNFAQLLLARFGVGIGEAGGTPASIAILADKFSPAKRPFALTIYALGTCIGAWAGASIAGAVAQVHGWRAAFLVFGIPGIAFSLLVWLTVREPTRGGLEPLAVLPKRRSLLETLRFISRRPAAVHLLMGGTVATFWSWGLVWWTPAFLMRSHQMTIAQAGSALGQMHLVAGTAGTIVAGWLVSRRAAANPRYVTNLLAVAVALGTIPSILAYWVPSESAALATLWIFVPAVYFFIGPSLGLFQNIIPPDMRATASAVLMFTANIANLIAAPQIIGWLSDAFAAQLGAGQESLRWALLILAPTGFWGAYHYWRAGATIRAEEEDIRSGNLASAVSLS